MNGVRKAFVGFLAFVLFVSLLWGVAAYNVKTNLSQPEKVETWLAESGIYDHVIPALLSQAQQDSDKNGTNTSISFKNPDIQAAASSAFTNDVLRASANKFIDSNYDWLAGTTTRPEFSIDLTKAKQDFASRVGDYVQKHLAALPACTPDQLAKLQIPVDPSTVACRPGSLDPVTEGRRVADEVANSSDFLEKPVVTADTLNQDASSPGKPYYEKLKNLPKVYQLGQNLVWAFILLTIILIAAIIFIHPSRRKGIRRVGTTLIVSGVLLIATKLTGNFLINNLQDAVLTNGTRGELDAPFAKFLNTGQDQLTRANMMFGIIFVLIGIAILVYLFVTREDRDRKQKPRQVNTTGNPVKTPPLSSPENRPQPPVQTEATDRTRPTGPPLLGTTPRPKPHSMPHRQGSPTPRPPKPPRLIQ